MSTFTCHCRATIMRILKSGNGCKLLTVDNHSRFLSYKVKSCGQSVRRIISSEVVGCHLLGYLKVTNFRLIVYVLLSCFIFFVGFCLIWMYPVCNCHGSSRMGGGTFLCFETLILLASSL